MGQFFVLLPIMLVLAWFNPADYQSQVSQLSPGTLSGNTYTNDAVGVSYEVPQGWTSTPDPSGPARIDPRHPESPMNQCTKVLLRLAAAGAVEGRFNSFGTLLAMDPNCFSHPTFPRTLDKKAINKVVDKMFKPFIDTLYVSPYGAHVGAHISQDRVVISLTGGMIINAVEGIPAPRKEPLPVKTSFSFTPQKHTKCICLAFCQALLTWGRLIIALRLQESQYQ